MAARREGLSLVTVAIHNDGGGIFSYLPVAEHSHRFEELFGTPHGLDLEPLARLHQMAFHRARGPEFAEIFGEALAAGTPSLIEVRLDRARSARLHRLAWEAAARAVEE
jgi:2-succinyl-5-enolpyruvyl-6-hydroxy-3-cyclohexene-1-carboxylate synthase